MIRQLLKSCARTGCLLALLLLPFGAFADTLTVFAAASLKTALDTIGADFTEATGHRLRISYAGSSALARQIQLGAPADVFVSANIAWMDLLAADGLLADDSRFDLASNALVVIAPRAAPRPQPLSLTEPGAFAARLGDGPLAMAMVRAVPAGIYGKEALGHIGLWPEIAHRVAQTDNVRAALALVAAGEAPLGIVYHSDALAEETVVVVAEIPPDSHAPITYPAAAVAEGNRALAAQFLDFLKTPAARKILTDQGFLRVMPDD
ncbi:molybdate ABC transporter substrate-binding protein [Shimia sp.]|uniref:molybdate ABC transporter substrate-binding protein n=1 Tax=Shimia sp. TaxID=1954381 RepID=UPI003562F4E0